MTKSDAPADVAITGELVIYGASDDLIKLDGTIREELSLSPSWDRAMFVALSDGTMLRFEYGADQERWMCNPIHSGRATVEIIPAPGPVGGGWSDPAGRYPSYSDRAHVTGAIIEWVMVSPEYVTGWDGGKLVHADG